jgi:hypothetical protein
MGERGLRAEMTANLARALAGQGRDDEALEVAAVSGEMAVRDDLYSQVERRGPLALVLARRGRLDEAERLAAEAIDGAARPMGHAGPAPTAWPGCCGWPAGRRAGAGGPALELADRKGRVVAADQAGNSSCLTAAGLAARWWPPSGRPEGAGRRRPGAATRDVGSCSRAAARAGPEEPGAGAAGRREAAPGDHRAALGRRPPAPGEGPLVELVAFST